MMGIIKQLALVVVCLLATFGLFYNYINATNLNPIQIRSLDQIPQLDDQQQRLPGFDYFLLALQWPNAYCNIARHRKPPPYGPKRLCVPDHPLPKHQNFTIHGLWPQLNIGVSPLNCSTTDQMTNKILSTFEQELLDYWPNLNSADSFTYSKSFWRYEWKKHGSCSSNVFKPDKYLRISLDLAKEHATSILLELKKAGINPDGVTPHHDADVREAVKKATKHEAMLNFQLNELGERLLSEIHLCVKQDGVTLFDCDPVSLFASVPSPSPAPVPPPPPPPPPPPRILTLPSLIMKEVAKSFKLSRRLL